jgi:hypothetical protein
MLKPTAGRVATIAAALLIISLLVLFLAVHYSAVEDVPNDTSDSAGNQGAESLVTADPANEGTQVEVSRDTRASEAELQASIGSAPLSDEIASIRNELTSKQVKRIDTLLTMDSTSFGKATDDPAQRLVEEYNKSRECISAVRLEADCRWWTDNASGVAPFTLDFSRKDLHAEFSCDCGVCRINRNVALYDAAWHKDVMDIYYLSSLSVFDPTTFRQAASVTLEYESDGQATPVSATRVESDGKVLFFRKSDGKLICLQHRDNPSSKPYVQIDFCDYGDTAFPVRTRVSLLDPTRFHDPKLAHWQPKRLELRVAPDALTIETTGR